MCTVSKLVIVIQHCTFVIHSSCSTARRTFRVVSSQYVITSIISTSTIEFSILNFVEFSFLASLKFSSVVVSGSPPSPSSSGRGDNTLIQLSRSSPSLPSGLNSTTSLSLLSSSLLNISIGAMVGIVVGTVVILVMLGILCIYSQKKAKRCNDEYYVSSPQQL
ncbi:hypothetical protein VNO80_10396 [Phaseolus coccineus]|uniref:Uncharacterized protein n=1 Tax=Phaseolus coccineus TaxID=3886 RepID=A0AAN9N8K7_PHACN